MTKERGKEWEADLDPQDKGRPGSYAVERAFENVNAADEELHWRQHYGSEPYCQPGRSYEYYALAYRVGYEGSARHRGREFDEAEPELQAEYERQAGEAHPRWSEARSAARAAWDRMKNLFADRA